MNAFRTFIMVGMAASMTVSVAACGGAPEDFELAEQEAELGELGCSTVYGTPYSGRNGTSVTAGACNSFQQFRSSSNTYTNGTTCADQYIAEIRDIQGRALSVQPVWRHDAIPLDATSCSNATIEVGTYMRNASTGTWSVHTSKLKGLYFLGGCWFLPESGYTYPPTLTGSEGYDLLRVGIKSTIGGIAVIKVPTGVDIYYPPSPC